MTTELYNLHADGFQYRITKFIDGDVIASYLLTESTCECPAGSRDTCRHRQMLPGMLNAGIINTHWFYDRMLGCICDINGKVPARIHIDLTTKSPIVLDFNQEIANLLATEGITPASVPKGQHVEGDAGSTPAVAANWRRI